MTPLIAALIWLSPAAVTPTKVSPVIRWTYTADDIESWQFQSRALDGPVLWMHIANPLNETVCKPRARMERLDEGLVCRLVAGCEWPVPDKNRIYRFRGITPDGHTTEWEELNDDLRLVCLSGLPPTASVGGAVEYVPGPGTCP